MFTTDPNREEDIRKQMVIPDTPKILKQTLRKWQQHLENKLESRIPEPF